MHRGTKISAAKSVTGFHDYTGGQAGGGWWTVLLTHKWTRLIKNQCCQKRDNWMWLEKKKKREGPVQVRLQQKIHCVLFLTHKINCVIYLLTFVRFGVCCLHFSWTSAASCPNNAAIGGEHLSWLQIGDKQQLQKSGCAAFLSKQRRSKSKCADPLSGFGTALTEVLRKEDAFFPSCSFVSLCNRFISFPFGSFGPNCFYTELNAELSVAGRILVKNKLNPSCWECLHPPGNWNEFITFTIYSGLGSFQRQAFMFGSRWTALCEVCLFIYLFVSPECFYQQLPKKKKNP